MAQVSSLQGLRLRGISLCFAMAGGIAILMVILASAFTTPATEVKSPIKIGVLYPLVGPYAFVGQEQIDGVRLTFERMGYKVANRNIELIVEDTEGKPDAGLMKVRKLIEKDKVHVLLGIVSSSVAYAVRDTVHSAKIPLVITMANAAGLTREKRSPYIYRTYQSDGAAMYYTGKYVYEKMGSRRAVFSAVDYAYGRENAEAFKKGFTEAGGEVIRELFVPLGTKDYGPYLTSIAKFAGKADTLAFVFAGSDAVKFVTGLEEYGLKDKFALLINWGATDVGKLLKQEGKAAVGIYEVNLYYKGLSNPANNEFVGLAKKKFGYVGAFHEAGYTGAEVVVQALKQIRGNIEDKADFLRAMRNLRFESCRGPFEFDPQGQNTLFNLYVLRNGIGGGEVVQVQTAVLPKMRDPWWVERSRQHETVFVQREGPRF